MPPERGGKMIVPSADMATVALVLAAERGGKELPVGEAPG